MIINLYVCVLILFFAITLIFILLLPIFRDTGFVNILLFVSSNTYLASAIFVIGNIDIDVTLFDTPIL